MHVLIYHAVTKHLQLVKGHLVLSVNHHDPNDHHHMIHVRNFDRDLNQAANGKEQTDYSL